MKEQARVSIVIPVYNGKKYMREAIDSALSQTYKNLEVIVVNDGSNDRGITEDIAKSYGNKIRFFTKENGGVSTALNLAIKNATGEYISWLSHDDVYYNKKIEKQIEYLKSLKNNEKIILYGDYELIDEKSRLIAECLKDHKMLEEKPEYAFLRGTINGITLLLPKKAFEDCGMFDESLRCTQDYELWMRMSKKYNFLHMEGIYSKSRHHREQVSNLNPKVIIEGNQLWINMIEDIADINKIRLEGGVYNYYKEMVRFLLDTPYNGAIEFCKRKTEKMEREIINNLNDIKVSVIIPFYNRKDLVLKAIESVTNQTHKNLEILLVNDGSKEEMFDILEFVKKDNRIVYVDIGSNKGVSYARNIGIERATGEYIAFLDSDDLFEKDKTKVQLFEMLLNEATVSHTSYLRKGFNVEEIKHTGLLKGKAIPEIIYSCGIATPTVMIKKEMLDKEGFRFNTKLLIGEDTCFWLDILRNNNILGIDKPLTIVNSNENSAAYNKEKQILGIKAIIRYVINDEEYSKYDNEVCLLLKLYIDLLNNNENKLFVEGLIGYCPNCNAMKNSTSWKITKPLRILIDFARYFKKYGIIKTIKKYFIK